MVRALLALVPALLAHACLAQGVVTLGLDSQDRYRGLPGPLPGPALRASAMADGPAGLYGGMSVVALARARQFGRAQAVLGISRRIGGDWAWDLALMRDHYPGNGDYDYTELMAGVIVGEQSLRAWASRHYYGQPPAALYLDWSGAMRLDSRWRLLAHLGSLSVAHGPAGDEPVTPRTDALLGVGLLTGSMDLRLSVDGLLRGRDSEDGGRVPHPGWLASASMAF